MAEFKKLAAVDMVETASDTATVLIEEDGVVKRAPKSTVGTVKSVNGIEADENGNVEIETAASWNDLADKPFWEEDPITVTLVDNLTDEDYGNGNAPKCTFIVGQKYNVTWNGTLYENLICHYSGEWRVLGTTEEGYPFYIDDDGGNDLYVSSDDGDWTLSITTQTEIVHQLDPKYIKDMYYEYMVPNNDEIMYSQTISDEYDGGYVDDINIINPLVESATYIVTWDNVEYTCVAQKSLNGTIYLGNPAIADWNEVSNEPFFLRIDDFFNENWRLYMQSAGEHTISIRGTGLKPVPHKIDIKYMPEEIGEVVEALDWFDERLDDLEGDMSTALNNASAAQSAVDAKMGKSNPTGTGSFSMNRKSGTTIGMNSHAVGVETTASGDYSVAFGNNTIAKNRSEHISGEFNDNKTLYVDASFIQGKNSLFLKSETFYYSTKYEFDVKTGIYTLIAPSVATSDQVCNLYGNGQWFIYDSSTRTLIPNVVQGTALLYSELRGQSFNDYNYSFSSAGYQQGREAYSSERGAYVHIVGNGTSDSARSNAHTLDWNGNAWYSGDVYIGSTSGTNRDEGSKKLATEEFVLDNRVCYEEESTLTFEETLSHIDATTNSTQRFDNLELAKRVLENGDQHTYTIRTCNTNETYVCNATWNNYGSGVGMYLYINNRHIFTIEAWPNVVCVAKQQGATAPFNDTYFDIIVSGSYEATTIHKIPEKYLPDSVINNVSADAVSYSAPQTLTDEQKAQARKNIGTLGANWQPSYPNDIYTNYFANIGSETSMDLENIYTVTSTVSSTGLAINGMVRSLVSLFGNNSYTNINNVAKNCIKEVKALYDSGYLSDSFAIAVSSKMNGTQVYYASVLYYPSDNELWVYDYNCMDRYLIIANDIVTHNSLQNRPDTTLSMMGISADAKAVGDAIANVAQLPAVTEADNGKVLMVVNGKWQLVTLNLSVDENGVMTIK